MVKRNSILLLSFFFLLLWLNISAFCQLQEINLTKPTAILGSNAENAPPEQSFYWPLSVDFDNSGHVYILDSGNQRIIEFDKSLNFIKEFGRQGQGPGEFSFRPAIINSGTMKIHINKLYVVDNNIRRVQIFSLDGKTLDSFHIFGESSSIDIDSRDNIYLNSYATMQDGQLIQVYDSKGNFKTSFAKKIVEKIPRKFPGVNDSKLCITSDGKLFLGFDHFPIIRKYTLDGKLFFEKLIDFSSSEAKKMAEKSQYFKIKPENVEKNYKKELRKIIIKGVQSASNGGCYVLISNRIFLLDANGNTVKIFTITNKEMPIFRFAVNEKQQRLYALDTVRNHRLVIYDLKK